MQNRTVFIDFLHGLLNLNPLERWSPQEARLHPFITGEKYLGPYVPSTRIKSIPMSIPMNTYSNNQATPTASTPINITTKSNTRRPRANTISSSRVQNVPPQLQRLAAFNPQNNVNSNNYSYNGPTQYQIIQQQSLSEMANLENISSTMNAPADNSRLSALLNTANGYDSSVLASGAPNSTGFLNNNGSQGQSSQIPTPNQQMLGVNNQSSINVQNDSQYLNNIFSDMHIDPSLYTNLNMSAPLSSSLDNLSSSNPRSRVRNNRRMDYNISTKHFRRQSFAGSSFSYINSMNNTRSNSSANISQNQNVDSNLQGTTSTHNNQPLSNLTSSIMNQHHNYSSSSLINIPEHQDYTNNTDNLAVVDHSSFIPPNTSNIVSPLNHTDQYIPNTSTIPDQIYIPNTNTVSQMSEHSSYTIPTTGGLMNIHDTSIFTNNDNKSSQSPVSASRNVSIDVLSDDSNNSMNKRLTPSQQQQTTRSSSSLAQSASLHDTNNQNTMEDDYYGKSTPTSSLRNSNLTPSSINNANANQNQNSTTMNVESDYYSTTNNYDSSQGSQANYSKDNYDVPYVLPMPYVGDLVDPSNTYSKWNMQRRASAPMIAFKKQQKSSYLSQRNSNLAYGSSYQSSSYGKDNSHMKAYNNDYYPDERAVNSYDYYSSNPSTMYAMSQDQKQPHHTRRVRYKSGPAESNAQMTNAATGLFMYNNPTQSMSYQSLPELITNQNPYSNSIEMDKPSLYHMSASNSTSNIPGLNQNNPNAAFHYTYNVALDPSQAPQQNNYYDPAYHDKFLSSYLFQKRHSVPTLHFMTKNTNLKQNSSGSNNYANYNNQDYVMAAQQPPTYFSNNNSYEDMPMMYGSGSKINKGKSYLSNKMNNKNYSNSSSAINISGGGMNKYSNYYQNSSLSRSLTNVQMMDDPNNNSINNLSTSNNSKKYYMDKAQKSNNSLNDPDFTGNGSNNSGFYNNRRRGSQSYQQHRKAKSMDNPNFSHNSSMKLDNYIKNKNKQYDSILSEKEAFVSKDNNSYSSINENNIRYEDEEDHMDEEEDDIVEVEVNYDEDNYSYDENHNEDTNKYS